MGEQAPRTPCRGVDVVRIMDEIRARNRERREAGLLTDEEVEERAVARFRAYAARAHIDPRLLERLVKPVGHNWNIATDYIVRTHRRGLLPRLSLVVKRLVKPVVRLYTDHVLDRQTQLNQYLFHLLHNALRENVRLEARLEALERRIAREAGPGGRRT